MGSRWVKAALVAAALVVALVIGSQWPTTSPGGDAVSTPSGSATGPATSGGTPTGRAHDSPSAPNSSSRKTSGPATASTRPGARTSPRPSPKPTAAPSARARAAFARMSLEQRVGQLFMVGTPATGGTGSISRAVAEQHVGNVMLTGRSELGVESTGRVSEDLQALANRRATAGVPLLVSTDQEGGAVQVLRGPGFSRMPSAVTQGEWSPARLRARAHDWGAQLAAAGVDMNLAPVLDTVPSGTAGENPPIGVFGRQYGSSEGAVRSHGLALAAGMRAAGVVPTVKHFPGLGRVHANTDTTAGVTDRVTTTGDVIGRPFTAAVRRGTPVVMMSTAIYARIDPDHPAAFSRRIVTGLLRDRLGFGGVVISDDLGAARQVAAWSPGERATSFIGAGGDLVLTVDGPFVPQMVSAVVDKARSDPGFRAKVDASALRVLQLKDSRGLLGR